MPPLELAENLAKSASIRIPVIEGLFTGEHLPFRELDASDPLSKLYVRMSSSVAKLESVKSFGATTKHASGSAFAFDQPGHFLTAEHCIAGAKDFWLVDEKGNVHDVDLLHNPDKQNDAAVLQLRDANAQRSFNPLSMYRPFDYVPSNEMLAFGYSRGFNTMSVSLGRDGKLSLDKNTLEFPMVTFGGFSGGPIAGRNAHPIGMVVRGNQRISQATTQHFLRTFAHQFKTERPTEARSGQTWNVNDTADARAATQKYWQRDFDQPWGDKEFHARLTRLNLPDRTITIRGAMNGRRMTLQPVAIDDEPLGKNWDLGQVTIQMDSRFQPTKVRTTNPQTARFLSNELNLPFLRPAG